MYNFRIINKRPDITDKRKNEYLVAHLKTGVTFTAKADYVRKQGSNVFINANIYNDGKIEILSKDKVVKENNRFVPVYLYNAKGEVECIDSKYETILLSYISTGTLVDTSIKLPKYCEVLKYDFEGIKNWLKTEFSFSITKKEMLELLSDLTGYIDDNVDLKDYFQDDLDDLKDSLMYNTRYDELESIRYSVKAVDEHSLESYRFIIYISDYDGYNSEDVNESPDGFSSWNDYYRWKNS